MAERNVLGGPLEPCGSDPLTGFYREHFVKKGAEAAQAVHQMLELDARLAAEDRADVA